MQYLLEVIVNEETQESSLVQGTAKGRTDKTAE